MAKRGIETTLVETETNPVIYGVKRGATDRAILFYSHYDVVPPGAPEEWTSPAFDTTIRDGRVWGRGTADHKGSTMARIQALDLLAERGDELPVTVKFLIEGNEEVGSQGLFDAMKTLGDELLGADGGFYSGWSRDLEGRPRINGGMRGGVTLKVEMRNTNRDLHGAYGSVVRDPLMSLIRLLGRLIDDNGQVALPGFMESADEPSAADRAALEKVPFNVDLLRSKFDVKQFVGSDTDRATLIAQQFFGPMITVYDIKASGVPGIGVPATASAFVKASLVPNQDPDEIAAMIESFLRKHADLPITVTKVRGMRPARAKLESTAVDVAVRSAREAYGEEPVLFPMSSGAGPRGLFVDAIGLPLIADAGVSHVESNDHSADENIYVDHYLTGIEHYAQIMRLWPKE
jgi:acetylornithine deacetylase/succinyl-diaminopimelate desuccinylase-like protein